ncbi:MAG TPA: hypothetical protein VIB39_09360 [Candidatus Angelobacter sp.]|jgi:hypothetical protein
MTINFADGTRIEVEASAFNDFIKYDLKWVEFVHGRASEPQLLHNKKPQSTNTPGKNVYRCPSRAC